MAEARQRTISSPYNQTTFTMAPINTLCVFLASLVAASAFVVPGSSRPATKLSESFGFDFAEDTYANQPDFLKGEGEYKTWIGQTKENSFVNRQVSRDSY